MPCPGRAQLLLSHFPLYQFNTFEYTLTPVVTARNKLPLVQVDAQSPAVKESPEHWTQFWGLCNACLEWPFWFLSQKLPWIFELAETDDAVGMTVGAIVVFSNWLLFALAGGLLALSLFFAVRRLGHAPIAKPASVTPAT